MRTRRTNSFIACLAGVLIVIAFVLRMQSFRSENVLLQTAFMTIRNVIHVTLLFMWCVSLHRRLVNVKIRRLMLIVGGLLVFWLVDKIIKWDFTGSVTHPLVRYLWYGFYVGMLFVPTLGAFIINYLGKPEGYAHPKHLNYLLLPPTLLLLTVFTNDLHQRVFVFYNGFINFDQEYGYGWMYFLNMGWFIVMGFYFVVMMLVKSRVPGSRKLQKLPLLIMVFAALFWVGYSLKLYNCDLTVTDCLIIALLLESAIQSGLLPSNRSYQQIFDVMTVPVQIVDHDYRTHYISAGAQPISKTLMQQTEQGTVHTGDTLLSSAPINAGRVVWQDDIAQLLELRVMLQETQEQLGEENILLKAELELMELRVQAEEKNLLYDRIAGETEAQLSHAEALLRQIESNPQNTRTLLAKLSVLGSYIKRRGNLLLLGEKQSAVNARELEYCLRESMENLRLLDVYTSFVFDCEGEVQLEHIVAAYDVYETVTEQWMEQMTAAMLRLHCEHGAISMRLQLGCRAQVETNTDWASMVPMGQCSCEISDEDVLIDLYIPAGGGSAC